MAARARGGFAARVLALDALDLRAAAGQGTQARGDEAAEVSAREILERANARVVGGLRRRIRGGRVSPAALRSGFAALARSTAGEEADLVLDQLVASLLDVGPPGEPHLALGPEMVAYQPTPARILMAMIERACLDLDAVFFDLGSGLGQVAVLVALLAGCRSVGIEIEPAYVEHARRSARALGLRNAEFVCADVRGASLAGGRVFFLYTPFRGSVLREVLASLERESAGRAITVCTFGPCTAEVQACAPWLVLGDDGDGPGVASDALAVFRGGRLASPASVPLY